MFLKDYRSLVRFDDRKMAKVNLFESHRMFADLYCLEPGQEQSIHSHEGEDKVYFVLEGSVEAILGERREKLAPGGLAVAPAGEPHGVRCSGPERAVLLVWMAPHPSGGL